MVLTNKISSRSSLVIRAGVHKSRVENDHPGNFIARKPNRLVVRKRIHLLVVRFGYG